MDGLKICSFIGFFMAMPCLVAEKVRERVENFETDVFFFFFFLKFDLLLGCVSSKMFSLLS